MAVTAPRISPRSPPSQTPILRVAGGVVAPELPNSSALPESGPAQETTMGRHRRASEDVWSWTTARWPELSMAVAGHSLGAYAAAHIASAADEVQHVLAVSPALSGAALLEARAVMGPPALEALAREAPKMRAEMSNEDATSALQTVQARLAVVSGALDGIVPVTTARSYFDAAPNGCFFAILPGHHHCPAGPDVDLVMSAALAALTPET